ncbi:hypothetical protein BN59_00159 [Legionella massiliensis]|uniref:Uncharacterized protein n=1 Tax=Legionella massiliensis TaxID=1034943 RepID=A0A078KVW5_9GAMM|nr:hypothetical protein [Legionella massiliensis]CDZ75899.1 hypothetical protein BN59_00159 [Legionella massiliensis]CEE11637.1 hypothetical protein BN1094_00159 [Legionella massiliensis]
MPRPRAIKKENLHMKAALDPKTTGHEVDFGTFTHDGDAYTPWITKLNKHKGVKGQEASVLEVAFSEAALLFIKPGLTPPAEIVVDNQEVVAGVASENFNVQIKRQMDQGETCYSFDASNWTYTEVPRVAAPDQEAINRQRQELAGRVDPDQVSDGAITARLQLEETKKAINFLSDKPQGFFADLMKKHNKGEVVVDMESLASILTASYVLEEDDLHKGNIGFYVTKVIDEAGNEKKKFNFFKIDHDLMFIDSIMSQKDMRIANIFYDKDSFKISTRDLDDFPDLQDSGNHYWPTQKRFIATGDKAYNSASEVEAFANLKNDLAFRNAKWKYFLKSAVMPVDLIEKSLTRHLDESEIDKSSMIRNSMWTRLGALKNKLLESEQFRVYLAEHGNKAFAEIREEIKGYVQAAGLTPAEQESLLAELDDNFNVMLFCARDKHLPTEDQQISAIQQSILLGNYNFSSRNKPSPDDVGSALDHFKQHKEPVDARSYAAACVAIDLIKKSGNEEDYTENLAELREAKRAYINPQEITTLKQFEAAADKIRSADLPLKQQKIQLFTLLRQANLPLDDLKKLKSDLQKSEPDSPSLKFVNQLRSELWLVKKIYGTYGKTTTSSLMVDEIDAQIAKACTTNSRSFKDRFLRATPQQNGDTSENLVENTSQTTFGSSG